MPAQSVQISLPGELLKEVDKRPETKRHGRSAIIQRALRLYLDEAQRRETDRAYERAYGGKARVIDDEFGQLMGGQEWPEK